MSQAADVWMADTHARLYVHTRMPLPSTYVHAASMDTSPRSCLHVCAYPNNYLHEPQGIGTYNDTRTHVHTAHGHTQPVTWRACGPVPNTYVCLWLCPPIHTCACTHAGLHMHPGGCYQSPHRPCFPHLYSMCQLVTMFFNNLGLLIPFPEPVRCLALDQAATTLHQAVESQMHTNTFHVDLHQVQVQPYANIHDPWPRVHPRTCRHRPTKTHWWCTTLKSSLG